MMLNHVMQGDLQPDGTYRWNVRKEHAMGTTVKEWNFDDPDAAIQQLKDIKDSK